MGRKPAVFRSFFADQFWGAVRRRLRIWWQQWPTVLLQASQALRKLGAAQSTYFGITSSHASFAVVFQIEGSFYLVLVQTLDPVCSWSAFYIYIYISAALRWLHKLGGHGFRCTFLNNSLLWKRSIWGWKKNTESYKQRKGWVKSYWQLVLKIIFLVLFYERRNIWADQDCADLPDPVEEEKHLPMA